MKVRGKEIAATITTWVEGWELPYAEDAASIHTPEIFADCESRATTSSVKRMPEPLFFCCTMCPRVTPGALG